MMKKYNTKQRSVILELFENEPDRCFSAKELIELCGSIGQATVYRTLAVLEHDGKIRRFHSSVGGDCFKLACRHAGENHMHIVCRSCGDMIHSDCDFIGEISRHLKSEHKFKLDTSSTIIYGFCEKCTEEAEL